MMRRIRVVGHGPVRAVQVSVTNVLADHIKAHLVELWKRNNWKKPLGLAISGGVDSMALATLCARTLKRIHHPGRLEAFIVDHGYRKGSAEEAVKVAEELRRLEIPSRILTLNWGSQDPGTMTNFESVARTLRLQALGRACYEESIENLLLAHHGDDCAETVLTRILAGYTGVGLGGMYAEHNISSCSGMYGVDRSGRPRAPETWTRLILIEDGGVKIQRPLLTFTKKALIEVCEKAGTKWFEDPTNKSPNLTTRNAVRSIEQIRLPVALRHDRLLSMAEKTQKWQQDVDARAKKLFEHMPVKLDLRLGTLNFSFHEKTSWVASSTSTEAVYRVQAELLRRLLHLVSPKPVISLQTLHYAVDYVFGTGSEPTVKSDEKPESITIADVQLSRLPSTSEYARQNFLFHRALPPRTTHQHDLLEASDLHVPAGNNVLTVRRTQWYLWDSRYWIRVSYQLPDSTQSTRYSFRIQYLTPGMVGFLIRKLKKSTTAYQGAADNLKRILNDIPWNIKRVLPVILAVSHGEPSIVALPTLGWANPLSVTPKDRRDRRSVRFKWDIRYKEVDFEQTERHQLLSTFGGLLPEERFTEERMESLGGDMSSA